MAFSSASSTHLIWEFNHRLLLTVPFSLAHTPVLVLLYLNPDGPIVSSGSNQHLHSIFSLFAVMCRIEADSLLHDSSFSQSLLYTLCLQASLLCRHA